MATNTSDSGSRSERIKFIAVISIIAICGIWLAIYLGSQISFSPPAKPLSTPGWKTAQEMNLKLLAEPDFADVALGVAEEKPLKLNVVGAVFSQKAMDRLPEFLKELNADAEYDIKVELMRKTH